MSHGTCTLSWSPFASLCTTSFKVALTPANVTLTLDSEVESGIDNADAVAALRFVPKIDTSDPGATGTPDLSKLAPLSTPPAAITGVCAFAAAPPSINIAAKKAAGIKTFIQRF